MLGQQQSLKPSIGDPNMNQKEGKAMKHQHVMNFYLYYDLTWRNLLVISLDVGKQKTEYQRPLRGGCGVTAFEVAGDNRLARRTTQCRTESEQTCPQSPWRSPQGCSWAWWPKMWQNAWTRSSRPALVVWRSSLWSRGSVTFELLAALAVLGHNLMYASDLLCQTFCQRI